MTKENLKAVFTKPYNRDDWQNLIRSVFPGTTFFSDPHPIPVPNEDIEEFFHTGNIRLNDGKSLAIFELHVSDKIKLKRNRVSLHTVISKYIDQESHHGVLALFDSNSEDYRFTFTAKDSQITEAGFETKATDAKRFTYVFGPNETCRTAADRFSKLAEKRDSITIDDVEDAFSVEKLNKEFFNQYKDQYEKFVCFITGKHFVKRQGKWVEEVVHEPHEYLISIFEDNDKQARDFIKKSLGRLVFLYFLQKKGWMGCSPDRSDWIDGDQKFMQHYYMECLDKDHFHSKFLVPLYFECLNLKRENDVFEPTNSRIPYLNGGLFEEDKLNTEDIDFPTEYWESLFKFFDQYNFTIDENDPFEQEVGIDPEMLGHIFENLLEDNKDKGAFYTPKPIVEYMCKESLIQYLKTHLFPNSPLQRGAPASDGAGCVTALENFIRNHDPGDPEDKNNYIRNNAEQIEKLLDDVKICDPAIGSGAFPMGLLQDIFWAKMTLDWTLNPAETKKKIIENSIYGVDIDSGAIDIARLRFWLSLIVDAEVPEPLPNLDYKIMQGNSLLESFEGIDLRNVMSDNFIVQTEINNAQDMFDFANDNPQQQMVFSDNRKQKVQELKHDYFIESDPQKKKQIHKEIDNIVLEHIEKCLEIHKDNLQLKITNLQKSIQDKAKGKNKDTQDHLWNQSNDGKLLRKFQQEFELVDKKYKKLEKLQFSTDRPFFLWHLYFSEVFDETGGFDIVIANPPYIQFQAMVYEEVEIYENANFQTFVRTGDIYTLFYELSFQISRKKGISTYITSNKWMSSGYGLKTRKFFVDNVETIQLIDFAKKKLFETATVFVNILIFSKEKYTNKTKACKIGDDFDLFNGNLSLYLKDKNILLENLTPQTWKVIGKSEESIMNKMNMSGIPLSNWPVVINAGIKTAFNPAFHIDSEKRDQLVSADSSNKKIIKPLLRGKDIKRYDHKFANMYMINSHNGIRDFDLKPIDVQKDFPSIFQHLLQYKEDLIKRQDQGKHWTNLRNCAFLLEFEKPKIVWLEISDVANFSYDDSNMYLTNSAYFMSGENLKYVLAIVNSKLSDFYFFRITAQIAGGRKRYTKQYVELIPVPKISESISIYYENIVNQILLDKKVSKDTQMLENQIDLMVYKLYELTYEESKIVDPELDKVLAEFGLSKADFERMGVEELAELEVL